MCWLLRSAIEHVKEMQSSGKGYLPGYGLNERNDSNEGKAEDQGNGGTAAAQKFAHQPATRRT